MEANSLLTLILLSSVGARNIPATMDEPSGELQHIIGRNLFSYTKALSDGELISKDPVEDAVRAGELKPTSKKDVNEESEEHNHNFAGIEEAKDIEYDNYSTNTKVDEKQNTDNMTAALNPAKVTNDDKETVKKLADRDGLDGNYCPNSGGRAGTACGKRV